MKASIGLRYLAALCGESDLSNYLAAGSTEHLFNAGEQNAAEYISKHVLQYGTLPTLETIETHTDAELEAASVLMDYFIAVGNFKKAVIKEYGPSGWSHFENEGGAKLSMDLAANRDKLDSAKIEVTGDKASCTVPGEAQVMHFSRKNGLWHVEAGMFVNTGRVDSRKFTTMWKQMTELIRRKQKRIGQAGVTAESLDMELGRQLMHILMSSRLGGGAR